MIVHNQRAEPESVIPFGPLASARYSIARREALGLRRAREMSAVARDARLAIRYHGDGDHAGYQSILGHALLQNGRLWESRAAFAESLRIRNLEADPGRVGEGLCDLGLARCLSLDLWNGTRMIEDGVEMLRSRDEMGFYFRGLRKLELAYRLRGQWRKARDLRDERQRVAQGRGYLDQV